MKDDVLFIVNEYPLYEGNNKSRPTFAGVLLEFIDKDIDENHIALSNYWSESTRKKHLSDYRLRLMPYLPIFKALSDFSFQDFITSFKNSIQDNRGEESKFNESYLQHFIYLFKIVYVAGANAGYYQQSISFDDTEEPDTAPEYDRKVIKKQYLKRSFSIKEEWILMQYFLTKDISSIPGAEIGVLLMFSLGVRNNEAAALTYSDIIHIEGTQYHVATVFKSTMLNSKKVKPGGKTPNAIRIIPVFETVFNLIQKRKTYIESIVDPDIDISSYPITASNTHYDVNVRAADIQKAGKQLFLRLGILSSECIEALSNSLSTFEARDRFFEESDPTVYAFRRNYMTHLYPLCSEAEIQYLVGHSIETGNESRSDFSAKDRIVEICKKFEEHPFRVLLNEITDLKHILKGNHLIIRLREPEQPLTIKNMTSTSYNLRSLSVKENNISSEVNINTQIIQRYLDVVRMLEQKEKTYV